VDLDLPDRQYEFMRLLEEHKTLIYKVCRLYCPEPADRQDLFQEIIFQLWKGFPGFRGEAKFGTWLYRVALNTAISAARKKKAGRVAPPWLEASESISWNKPQAQWNYLEKAVAQLGRVEKSILMLYLEDRTYEEMEEILGIPRATLRVKVNRIKEKLKKTWQLTSSNIFGDQ